MFSTMLGKILYQKRWMMFWWFVAITATGLVTLLFFPAFKGSNIGQLFNSLPSSVQHMVGDAKSFTSLSGYISQEIFGLRASMIVLILGIITFNSLTVSEERKGILETQVGLPLTRSKILLNKIIAGIIIISVCSFGFFVGIELALFFIHDHFSALALLKLILNCTVLGISFGLILVFLNSIFGIRAIVLGLTCAYALISYLISSLATTVISLKTVDKFSLFHYYNIQGIFSYHDLLIKVYICIALIILSFFFFSKRDIET